ncbi:hypothetical protein E1A91_A05G385900v1 [Gossypium mustelinum]|uniref:Uncharacterized protein n=1 Tax=Gossypium mustelinum TaxID=34275 RepID=A0A5D2ZFI3_GOSMU|nr:hypothetical protein E1A91_A05G385900v1 [Gossypium mustelinum]
MLQSIIKSLAVLKKKEGFVDAADFMMMRFKFIVVTNKK